MQTARLKTKTRTSIVTVDNFTRAETDMYFAAVVRQAGLGRLEHTREPIPVDKPTIVRPNRDTLYSSGIFDLDAGAVTITMPDAGKRFLSLLAIDEDHYWTSVTYEPGAHTFSRSTVGTRYVLIGVRTQVNPSSWKDLLQVRALQNAILVGQKSVGRFDVPHWDQASQKKVREALLELGRTLPDSRAMFGARDRVVPMRHLIGTATAWGTIPEEDTIYLAVTPEKNDGATNHRLVVKDVPVDGFWSISVYNDRGYFEPNHFGAYTLTNITAKTSDDGSVQIQFGARDCKIANCLPITPGWSYMVRLYRPRSEILHGKWIFPEAQPID